MKAEEVIKMMKLEPLVGEGGFFRRTYSSSQAAEWHGVARPIVSAIYYLITQEDFSALHLLKRDETFHFYAGDPIEFIKIRDGKLETTVFGNNIARGETPQVVVEGNTWQALRLFELDHAKLGWALMGTTVSPAFEYDDYLIGERKKLLKDFPYLSDTIMRFTRDGAKS
jgi:hypothetical protein